MSKCCQNPSLADAELDDIGADELLPLCANCGSLWTLPFPRRNNTSGSHVSTLTFADHDLSSNLPIFKLHHQRQIGLDTPSLMRLHAALKALNAISLCDRILELLQSLLSDERLPFLHSTLPPTQGRLNLLTSVCIYHAIRERSLPNTLEDICSALTVTPVQFTSHILSLRPYLPTLPSHDPEIYIPKVLHAMDPTAEPLENRKRENLALRFLKLARVAYAHVGRRPAIVGAAAAILGFEAHQGVRAPMYFYERAASVAKANLKTLRGRHDELLEVFVVAASALPWGTDITLANVYRYMEDFSKYVVVPEAREGNASLQPPSFVKSVQMREERESLIRLARQSVQQRESGGESMEVPKLKVVRLLLERGWSDERIVGTKHLPTLEDLEFVDDDDDDRFGPTSDDEEVEENHDDMRWDEPCEDGDFGYQNGDEWDDDEYVDDEERRLTELLSGKNIGRPAKRVKLR
ncbi:hypothetical protein BJ742DRAFT_171780 [Cladochytrium replicatum]|nr:hypothetical protein BJ742DRAFT_171780 [Cladochytrium replicatum]